MEGAVDIIQTSLYGSQMEFWPLMYYPEMDRAFVANYGNAIDGVVAAYPKASTSRSADFDSNGKIEFEDFLLFANAYGKTVGEYATVFAPFDLDLDGKVGFGDFLIFAQAFETS